jgi:hypothetical protein
MKFPRGETWWCRWNLLHHDFFLFCNYFFPPSPPDADIVGNDEKGNKKNEKKRVNEKPSLHRGRENDGRLLDKQSVGTRMHALRRIKHSTEMKTNAYLSILTRFSRANSSLGVTSDVMKVVSNENKASSKKKQMQINDFFFSKTEARLLI